MSSLERENILRDYVADHTKDYVLSNRPTSTELLPYVRLNIKKGRLRKKFLKNPMRYRSRLPKKVVSEYTSKLLSLSISHVV